MVLILPGCFIAGLLIYSILAQFHTPLGVSIPLSILISILIFGLNKFYFTPQTDPEDKRKSQEHFIRGNFFTRGSINLVFIWSYGILISILIATSISDQNNYESYVSWEKITFFDTIILANAIAFSFFLPGYGLVAVVDKNYRLTSPLRLLLSYLVSMLLVALPSYVGASLGYGISDTEPFIILLYVGILILFLFRHPNKEGSDFFRPWATFRKGSLSRVCNILTNRISEFVVLASLLALVVFCTYYLNDGVIVVDQWFHHGRALLIGSELYREIAPAEFYEDPYTDVGSDVTQIYPPIFSSMLAGFFELSNSASVNAYVSIGFLNAMPVLAFYYFFTRWVPNRLKRASLLAAVLFVLSSGFGWVYAVDLAIVSPPGNEKDPKISSVNIFAQASDMTYDIGLPNTFINVGHPDITTPLIIIALPAGFTLLGMMKEFAIKKGEEGEQPQITEAHANKSRILELAVSRAYLPTLGRAPGTTMRALLLIIIVSFLGILSHDEFHLFIVIACVAILALLAVPPAKQSPETPKRPCTRNPTMEYYVFFSSFLIAILLVALLDSFVSPAKYYVTREIGGVPLIFLSFIFVSSSWLIYTAIYVARRRWNFFSTSSEKSDISRKSGNIGSREIRTGFLERRRFYYAISRMKKNISRPSKIKNLLSISNCSSPDTSNRVDSRIGNGVSLRVSRTIRLALPMATVSLIAFLYLFTFLVWSQLSVEDIKFQTDTENEWNIPWYLYPMKFGLTGLFGLAFLLSYLFKKFEREIFVFLIVAVVAFVSGPYYDEHRFGKYIMAGMACLAALLIYEIISGVLSFTPKMKHPIILRSKFNIVTGGILLGLVITFSSLSILMFASFVEQITNVADFNGDTRRDFPTHSEIQLLDFLNARLIAHKPDKNYNIALPENEVDNNRGFLTKLYGFTPIPRAKLLQTPSVLNASTIETFYNLLDYGDTKFIVIPKEDFSVGISSMSNVHTNDSIIQFALENFPRVFENDSYLVLGVPSLSPPSPKGDVALIYPKHELFSPALDKKEETYYQHYYPLSMLALSKIDYNTFIEGDFSAFSKKYVIVPFDPPTTNSKLSLHTSVESASAGEKLDESIYLDYVRSGGNLIVIDSADDSKPYDKTGMFSKLLSLSPTGNYAIFSSISDTTSIRTLKSTTSNEKHNDTGEQKQAAQDFKRGYGNMLNISGTVEEILYSATNYSKDNNTSVKSYYTTENKDHNNITQNAIVAPFIIEKKYGNGTVTYVNAHGYFHAISNGLSPVSNNNDNPYPSSRDHYFYTLANITNLVYRDLARGDGRLSNGISDNSVSDTGRGPGAKKIIQILDDIQISSGYVTRINSSSLLLSINNSSNTNLAAKEVTFKPSPPNSTSSLTVTNLSTKNITTHIDTNDWRHGDMASHLLQSNSITDEDPNYKYSIKNAKIRNLKIYGSYEIIVESTANSKPFFPAFPSLSDYVAIGFPNSFDMTIKLSVIKPSFAEFEIIGDIHGGASTMSGNFQRLRVYGENTKENSTSISGSLSLANITSNEIHFHNVRSDLTSNGLTSLLMKSPQFQVKKEGAGADGMHGPAKSGPQENTILTFKKDSPEAEPIKVTNEEGRNNDSLIFRIDYVDSYNQPHREGVKKHYLSYIEEDIEAVQARSSDYQYSAKVTERLKLPGDISERAKRQGVEVQWQKTMTSDSGLLLAASIIMSSIIATKIAVAKMNPTR